MFVGCANLVEIRVGFTSWYTGSTASWVSAVSQTGTFICPTELPETRGLSNIPSEWTIQHPTPAMYIKKFYINGKSVKTLFLDGNEVYVETFDPIVLPYLTFTAEQANSTVTINKNGSAPTLNLKYSIDGSTWNDFTIGSTVVTLPNIGDKV